MNADARVDAGPQRAVRILQSAGGALLVQAVLHGQLAAIEWKEERHRLQRMLVLTLAGFACLLCTLLFAGTLALSASWETGYRIHVLALLILLFGFGTVLAWQRFGIRSAAGDHAFSASREELAADIAMLKANSVRR